jgi:ubiquinone biosynthesis monooxygenase Coq7
MSKMSNNHKFPGELSSQQLIERIIRVDHAGEYGAARIYDGQLEVLKDTPSGPIIKKMALQEQQHLDYFDKLVVDRRVRPTALSPLWHVAGYALGVFSAKLGENAAMTCTVAVESVIDEHYLKQINALGEHETDLRDKLTEFRRDEINHRDTASARVQKDSVKLKTLGNVVRSATRTAIWLSERL